MKTAQIFQIDLVERCKANDRQAQLKLYRQYCQAMFNVAVRFVKNRDDAEDVLQEAFIKAFQKIDQFEGGVSFGAWLKRIVINKSIDHLKAKRERYVELKENILHVVEDNDWTVDREITIKEVKQAIENLPEKYRFVVQLYLVEGYDHGEISQILGIAATTCRTRLLRGKAHIKEMLKKQNYVTGS